MTSIALPRIKAKRRKRRPPNRREKIAIVSFFFCTFVAIVGVVVILWALQARHPRGVVLSVLVVSQLPNLWNVCHFWRIVLDYLQNGFEDD